MLLLFACLIGAALRAQSCPNFGSQLVPASWTAAPVSLVCPGSGTWPAWLLFTPRHRAPTPHAGFRPGAARQRPALLLRYACTGFLFAPVALVRVRTMGYVVDMPEESCR